MFGNSQKNEIVKDEETIRAPLTSFFIFDGLFLKIILVILHVWPGIVETLFVSSSTFFLSLEIMS